MKNTLSFLSLKHIKETILSIGTRFPIATALACINTGLLWYEIMRDDLLANQNPIIHTILAVIVTFFVSVGATLWSESRARSGGKNISQWSQGAALAYGVVMYFSLNGLNMGGGGQYEIFFMLHLVGFVAWIFFAPFVLQKDHNTEVTIQYTNYVTHVAWTLLMAAIVGGAVTALGSIAIAAVDALFDISFFVSGSELYARWASLALSLIAPLYGLAHLPERSSVAKNTYTTNTFFSFLVRFIITPFIFLYFCILYAYTFKVLLNIHDWPQGEVSWLVIGFSTFGYLGYLFAKPYEKDHTMVSVFRRFLPLAVLLQIPMLAYAIGLRIQQYDLTINRYLVAIFGLWLTIISISYVTKKRTSLIMIPATLTVIALIISVGPWGVYQLPLNRQYDRLVRHLEQSKMLNNGVVSRAPESLSITMQNDIASGIEYVCKFENCNRIKSLFAEQLAGEAEKDERNWYTSPYGTGEPYPGMSEWTIINIVTDSIGVARKNGPIYDTPQDKDAPSQYSHFIYTSNAKSLYEAPLEVAGFSTIYTLETHTIGSQLPLSGDFAMIDVDTAELRLRQDGRDTVFSLADINTRLLEKSQGTSQTLKEEDMTFTIESSGRSVKLILQNYAVKNPQSSATPIDVSPSVSGYALVK